MVARLVSLVCSDAAKCWKRAGFDIGIHGGREYCFISPVTIWFDESVPGKGFRSWEWSELPSDTSDIDGVPASIVTVTDKYEKTVRHPNGTVSVDHIVLRSGNLASTRAAFSGIGVDLKREREDIYPGITQLFYRPNGEVIIEVVGAKDSDTNDTSFLWGMTVTVDDDLTTVKNLLGDNLSKIKAAQQPGRKITTLRHKNLGMNVALALMTKHESSKL